MDLAPALRRIDAYQRRHRWLALPVAVQKKFGEDEGGSLCAMLTYYGFLSLFPLLLVFFTVLGFVLDGNPSLQQDLRTSALANVPIIGDQIAQNVTSVQGSGVALVVGLLGTLWGGLGIANAAQDAMNRIWSVPRRSRPGFVPRVVRDLVLLATIGVAIVATAILGAAAGFVSGNVGWRVVAALLALAMDTAVFLFAFRLLTARELPWSAFLPGAVLAAVGWEILHLVLGAYASHVLNGMSQTYGMFAIVLGALGWIFLQVRVVVYAVEFNVVRHDCLWPRALVSVPGQRADDAPAGRDPRRHDGGREGDEKRAHGHEEEDPGRGEARVARHPELVGEQPPGASPPD
jgi:membrane protein